VVPITNRKEYRSALKKALAHTVAESPSAATTVLDDRGCVFEVTKPCDEGHAHSNVYAVRLVEYLAN
jgi:ribosomal protein L4